ncbi:hypothetical protein VTL71DRAFT_11928 [Oculimacula yallundae]|uniref:Uncharacterized protein n=1 Tax=Oculimacula yallundae TaxID=86028 RepID=A0ABR4CRJ7_9HELO
MSRSKKYVSIGCRQSRGARLIFDACIFSSHNQIWQFGSCSKDLVFARSALASSSKHLIVQPSRSKCLAKMT